MKPASWSKPAKHSRGNIFEGTAKYTYYGPEYLQNYMTIKEYQIFQTKQHIGECQISIVYNIGREQRYLQVYREFYHMVVSSTVTKYLQCVFSKDHNRKSAKFRKFSENS